MPTVAETDEGCVGRSGIVTDSRPDDVRPGRSDQALPVGNQQAYPLRTQPKGKRVNVPPATIDPR